ncbi:MAG: outer membrane beta-barrel protein [Chitinophagaceae bacterium]|nr:outer membrane beta-barrel protein [Chitinophagaceae bacterium]
MKYFLLAASAILVCYTGFAQFEFASSYTLGVPQKQMASHIQPAHQLMLGGHYRLPVKNHDLWVGVDGGFGIYGIKTINQTFTFRDGSTTKTDVRYSNTVEAINAVIRYQIRTKGRVSPYATAAAGLINLATDIYIEDPSDPLACEALEAKRVFSDNTLALTYGAGLRIKTGDRDKSGSGYEIDFAILNTRGGNIDYTNVRHLGSHQGHSDPNGESKPLNAKFINVNTQEIHEHQVAEIYNSPLRMLQFRLGITMKL